MRRREVVADFLESQNTLALSTADAAGTPHVTPLFYVAGGDLRLCWFSAKSARHSRNIRRNPAAAVAVYGCTEEWREIRGVQMRGTAAIVENGEDRENVAARYARRFRLGRSFEAVMAKSGLYVFTPAWVRYLDNSRGFGYKFELAMEHQERG